MRNLLDSLWLHQGQGREPEIAVHKILGTLKVQYEPHRSDLPGKPDIVLSRQKKVIFVHGCFWHVHRCRYGRVRPAKNWRFWRDKREQNPERDRRNRRRLKAKGWEVLTLWECWSKGRLVAALTEFLAH